MEETSEITTKKTRKKSETGAEKDAKIEALTLEVEDYKDRWIRSQADFDNYRKRNNDAVSKARETGASAVYENMLAVLDNLERAIKAMKDEADIKGVEMITRQMKDVLTAGGVAEIEADGCDFNPEFHEAVMSEEVEGIEEGKVVAVFQKGYVYKGRVLRPSVVKVSK